MLRFQFGQNWQNFSARHMSHERVQVAANALQKLVDLQEKTFLDAGCGSGIHSLAAAQLGTTQVHGFDLDPVSVQTSQANAEQLDLAQTLSFEVGSLLDESFIKNLGQFDVVYSWGVVHHTGAMYKAMRNLAQAVRPGGLLILSIYQRHWSSLYWWHIKKIYNAIPAWQRPIEVVGAGAIVGAMLATGRDPFTKIRGMDFWYDMVDWIGGYPYEYANPDELAPFFERLGLVMEQVIPWPGGPTGPSEYVCRRNT